MKKKVKILGMKILGDRRLMVHQGGVELMKFKEFKGPNRRKGNEARSPQSRWKSAMALVFLILANCNRHRRSPIIGSVRDE